MAGGNERHNLIAGNVFASFHRQFAGRPCKVYPADMRVKVSNTGLYTYPDVSALCGEARFEDDERDTLLNPAVIVEVLSRSTEAYDRGEKFAHYRRVASLTEYLLIAQDRAHVEQFSRESDGRWVIADWSELDGAVEVPALGIRLSLSEVYEKVDLSGPSPRASFPPGPAE